MVQSRSPTIDNVISLAKFLNKSATPDRSSALKDAKLRLETAQKNARTARDPNRANDLAESAKDSLDIAEEKRIKAVSTYNLVADKLNQIKAAQKTPDELQLLADSVETAKDRLDRASRKVDKLQEAVNLGSAKLRQARQLEKSETELESLESLLNVDREKLSRASIQFRARQDEFKQAEQALSQARKLTKTPEELKLLEDRLNEAQGQVDRATKKVADAQQNYQQALTTAQTTTAEAQKLEAELAIALADYEKITEATEAEERFAAIEAHLQTFEKGLQTTREVTDVVDPFLNAEFWWNSACLGATALVAVMYFTPLGAVLQNTVKAVKWTAGAVGNAKQYVDSTFAPNLKDVPKEGETIAGWVVTSGFGPRTSPTAGASKDHGGIDLADPRGPKFTTGRELYGIGTPGTKLQLTCWQDTGGGGLVATLKPESLPYTIEYLHLSKCQLKNGETKTVSAGKVIALVGRSGVGTAAHLHLQVKDANGKKIPPPRSIAWWALTGEMPQPVIAQKRITK
jgi:murein DD-endopeptidase MepM/ murein hydrolase activator NlpD